MNDITTDVRKLPNFAQFFRLSNLIPLLLYFLLFRKTSQYVKNNFWLSFKGFKKYRLQNLTICWLHAVIVGISDLILMATHQYEIYHEVQDWWNPIAAQIPLISIAYFIQDALDMLSYEWSRWTIELLLHHVMTCFCLSIPAISDKFLIATGWALLMEVNSIFLHARTILQICGLSKRFPTVFNSVIYGNLITFLLFRIYAQILWIKWAVVNLPSCHWYYQLLGLVGPFLFFIINGILFLRFIASDGFLPQYIANRFTINRDKDRNEEGKSSSKNE